MLQASTTTHPPCLPAPPTAKCHASCRHAAACEATRGGEPALLDLRGVVERVGPFSTGDRLVHPDAPHRAAFAVLSGMAMTVTTSGRVLAFHLPGELFALDTARSRKHGASIVAVGKTWFCRFPREATDTVCEHNDAVARHLRGLRLRERKRTGTVREGDASERVRSLLAGLFERRRRIEGPATLIPLPMSRDDIASYLDMSAATVTRMLARWRAAHVIRIHADGVEVLNAAALACAGDPAAA